MTNVRYWIGVASKEHVRLGVKGRFAQFSHGKLAPARRPSQGDWVIYYSPKLRFGEAEPCQKFVAIGQVTDDEPFQVEQFPDFKPWRRKIRYERAAEADIRALIERLSFIKNKTKWGAAFRFGFFEISKSDFRAIAKRMLGRRARAPGNPTGSRDTASRWGGFQPFLPRPVQPVPVGPQEGGDQGARTAYSRQKHRVDVSSDSSEPPMGSPHGL